MSQKRLKVLSIFFLTSNGVPQNGREGSSNNNCTALRHGRRWLYCLITEKLCFRILFKKAIMRQRKTGKEKIVTFGTSKRFRVALCRNKLHSKIQPHVFGIACTFHSTLYTSQQHVSCRQTGLVFSAYASCRRRCVSGYGVRVLWCVSGVVATGEALVNVICKSVGVSSDQHHITRNHNARNAEVNALEA